MQSEFIDPSITTRTTNMKTFHTLMALTTLAALPLVTVTAVHASTGTPGEIKFEDEETKTINLKITGMT